MSSVASMNAANANSNDYCRLPEMLPLLQTGDLVLFQSDTFTAKFFQNALKAKYSHLGVVVIVPGLQKMPLLLEPDPDASFICNWPTATIAHLHLIDVSSRLSSWQDGKNNCASIRRLQAMP